MRTDKLNYNEVKHCIESFVLGVNTPSCWERSPRFSNITLDWTRCLPPRRSALCIVGGKPMDFTYGDCQAEMDLINKAFIEVMIEGDANGRGFQYPIPLFPYEEFRLVRAEQRLLFEMTCKYGTPISPLYPNSDMEPGDVRSMLPPAAGSAGAAQKKAAASSAAASPPALWAS